MCKPLRPPEEMEHSLDWCVVTPLLGKLRLKEFSGTGCFGFRFGGFGYEYLLPGLRVFKDAGV